MRGRLSILVCLAFVLAACGGGGSGTTTTSGASSAEQWAGGVCSAVSTYEHALTHAASSFTKNPSKAGMDDALSQAKQATDQLTTTLKGLGKPNTAAGQAARTTVEDLATTISSDVKTIEHTANANALQAATSIATTLTAMKTSITQAIDKLEGLNGGELKDAFDSAPSCAKVTGS
jgi:hypothetical protein